MVKMARNGNSFDERAAWMREKHSSVSPVPSSPSLYSERHFSVAEIAKMWSLSQDAVRKIFHNEPGVLVLGDQNTQHKRRYTTLRVPESIVHRVHRRLVNV